MTSVQMGDESSDYPLSRPDFSFVNAMFEKGEFFIDSFTYTPFIDYSQTEYDDEHESSDVRKTGVYSDKFLTDYNCGRYEESYSGEEKKQ